MTRRVGVLVALFALAATASAQTADKKAATGKKAAAGAKKKAPEPPAATDSGSAAEHEPTPEEIEASLPPHISGPKLVDLGNDIEIDVPAGMVLFEHDEAKKILEKGGDHADNVLAVIGKIDSEWLVLVEYEGSGYVNDSDADQLDAGELLKSYEEGTKQQNIERKKLGVPELIIDGWSEMPKYDKSKRQLVWGLNAHSNQMPVINYFTRILGRNGYMSVNLIDSPDRIEASKAATAGLYAAMRFKAGATYADHKDGDKSSGIGLRALVLGGTGLAVLKVAKTGLLIKLLLVFKKGLILVFAAVGGFFKMLFGRGKKKAENDVVSDAPPPSDDDGASAT